jgi:Arc/MetJ-type ribon-helix-helix transcriptional regulator
MTIQLPPELESSIKVMVHNGRFASVDDAMAEAARLLLREAKKETASGSRTATTASMDAINSPDPLLGSMADAADELDQIVADAYKRRHDEPWRTVSVE